MIKDEVIDQACLTLRDIGIWRENLFTYMSTCLKVTYGQKTKVKDFASLLRKTFKERTDILFGRKNGWVKNIPQRVLKNLLSRC